MERTLLVVGLALFGKLYDGVDHIERLVDRRLVGRSDLDVAALVDLVDADCSAAGFLNALNDLSARRPMTAPISSLGMSMVTMRGTWGL